MKVSQRAQLGHQLAMTPMLLQSIRLLQLNSLQLEMEIRQTLDRNPLLEQVEDVTDSADEHFDGGFGFGDGLGGGADYVDSSGSREQPRSSDVRVRILENLALERLSERELHAAAWLLDRVDDNGYLLLALADVEVQCTAECGIDNAAFRRIRHLILHGDPAGYGACDLRESLLAQLDACNADATVDVLARRAVAEHLALVADGSAETLGQALSCAPAQAHAAMQLIAQLDPKPGFQAEDVNYQASLPDVIVDYVDGAWRVALNPMTAPTVQVDATMEEQLQRAPDSDAGHRLREMLQQARWFQRGLTMRYDTLLRATRAIVARQGAFLAHGEEELAPLTLKQIAADIGMHESTISRIASGKFIRTPRGTFEIKRFFAARLDGASVSGSAVRAMVKRMIDGETAGHALADDVIAAMLRRDGIAIARRTVAKYREQLQIPAARMRAAAPLALSA